jgi:hypothetical protein
MSGIEDRVLALGGMLQAQLDEAAKAVGVAVEDVVMGHVINLCSIGAAGRNQHFLTPLSLHKKH